MYTLVQGKQKTLYPCLCILYTEEVILVNSNATEITVFPAP